VHHKSHVATEAGQLPAGAAVTEAGEEPPAAVEADVWRLRLESKAEEPSNYLCSASQFFLMILRTDLDAGHRQPSWRCQALLLHSLDLERMGNKYNGGRLVRTRRLCGGERDREGFIRLTTKTVAYRQKLFTENSWRT
jgi:hypothetical protein